MGHTASQRSPFMVGDGSLLGASPRLPAGAPDLSPVCFSVSSPYPTPGFPAVHVREGLLSNVSVSSMWSGLPNAQV